MKLKLFSTLLITLSLCGFILLALPFALAYIPKEVDITHEVFSIEIPKIKAKSKIVPSVDPWDKEIYSTALKQGIAHAKGTGVPDENKGMFLFAHSSLPYLEMLQAQPVFFRLPELEKGDEIIITYNKKRYRYTVTDKKVVWPSDTTYLHSPPTDLILQTCTPPGTDFQRLLVFAKKN